MKTISILLSVLFSINTASALPVTAKITLEDIQIMANQSESYNFEGIVKLDNCSGALVRFEHSNDNDKAMVMSNGHCVSMGPMGGFIKPGQYLFNKVAKRSFRFLNKDGSLSSNSVNSTKILYATMTGTDVSLYEVDMTYAQIKNKFQVNALMLDANHPVDGEPIDILSGYWQKGYSCQINGFVYKMKEDAYEWFDSLRYSKTGCRTIHGTSGSPIISRNTGKVIGINNTGNDDGQKCTMNNPCEVSQEGTIYAEQGLSYGQQTYRFYTCLNEQGALDIRVKGCELLH